MFLLNFIRNFYHYSLAFLSAFIYGFPSKKLKVIGITGTKGKSTAVDLVSRILKEAGHKVAYLSSIKIKIADREEKNLFKMTMPGRGYVQKFLKKAVLSDCDYAVIEVTSEGVLQHRQKFIDFEAAVFTNLSPEHIERHGSFENYRVAKGRFFKEVKKIHILNLDDKNSDYFLQFPAEEKFGYRIKHKEFRIEEVKSQKFGENIKIVKADKIKIEENSSSFVIHNSSFKIQLLGEFNIYNSLAAICVGLSQGVSLETCRTALEKVAGISGRMEFVIKEPFKVVVDYAHTPDALEKVYQTLYHQFINSSTHQLICVLGSAGGGRDKWKRPKMGEIAAEYCDKIILTDEDPYDENPLSIIKEIESGFSQIPNSKFQIPKYEKILDRREAIKKALTLANPGDTVIITGKGCEPWMCVAGGKKIPWDDREIVKEEFKRINGLTD